MANIQVQIPDRLAFLLQKKARYKVLFGGRGSSKSWSVAAALLVLAVQHKVRVLCTREVQKSIKDSVHRLLTDLIERLDLSDRFQVLRDEIRGSNGSQFLFAGLSDHTADTLKSFEGIDYCWVEEAQTVSERSWDILIPTIRADGSEIWVTFNPDLESDPTYQRFVVKKPTDAIVVEVNWGDNPWFPAVLRQEMEDCYREDPEKAAWIWGGKCRKNSDAQILKKLSFFAFEPRDTWDGPYHGLDFGFARDPLVFVRCWIYEDCLYLEYDVNGLEVPIDHTSALMETIPGARDYVVRADSARPEMINHLIRQGWTRMAHAYKWPGSIEDGVDVLRSFHKIIVHPRCELAKQELQLYSYRKDRLTGDILPDIVDRYNNVADAMRYAIEPYIMGVKKKTPAREEKEDRSFYGPSSSGTSWMR